MTKTITAAALLASIATTLSATGYAQAGRAYVYVVGSSTVYPFATIVSERSGRVSHHRTPKIESTGSGGGFKLSFEGVGDDCPEITNSWRRIKASELATCAGNGVTDIIDVKIGYDGIVFANAIGANDAVLPEASARYVELHALSRNLLASAALGLATIGGITGWRRVSPELPAALPRIVGGILLAVSRAIGETMIVVMAAGLAAKLTANTFQAVTTFTVQIVTLLVGDQEFDSAKILAAFAPGLVLFVIRMSLNVLGLNVVRKYREQYV